MTTTITQAELLEICYRHPESYTISQVAKKLSVKRKAVLELIATGQIQTWNLKIDQDTPIEREHKRVTNWALADYFLREEERRAERVGTQS